MRLDGKQRLRRHTDGHRGGVLPERRLTDPTRVGHGEVVSRVAAKHRRRWPGKIL